MQAFDTLEYVNELKEAGISEKQAEIQAKTLSKALNDFIKENLATKQDIAEAKIEIIKWVAGMFIIQTGILITLAKLL